MGLQDFTYRLKAESGDTTPHDETANSADLTGGTISLVSAGGGHAWQITGGKASAGTTARTINVSAAGGGVTLAVRMAVTGYAGGFEYLAGWCVDTTPSRGLVIGQAGANNTRDRYVSSTSATGNSITVNADFRTYVLRLTAPDSCVVKKWINTTGRSGTAADNTSNAVNVIINDVLDTVFAGISGATVQISDIVLWPEELSDANCAAIADDLRGTLDALAGSSGSFALTSADATFSGGGIVRPMASFAITADSATFSGGAGEISAGSYAVTTANSAFAGGATGDVTQGTITCPALKNNAGTVLANEVGVTAYVYSVATGAPVVSKTGLTTNASGILVFTDAAIAAGTTYRVVIVLGSGAEGMDKVAAT